MKKTAIPKRLPAPLMAASAEREFYRNLLKYQRVFQKMVTQGLAELIPSLKAEAAEVLPEQQHVDSLHNSKIVTQRCDTKAEAVSIVVFRGKSILMGKRRDTGKWTLPGGHVNELEEPRPAARRELQEETGILIRHPEYVQTYVTETAIVHVFTVISTQAEMPHTARLDPDNEVLSWEWVPIVNWMLPADVVSNLQHSPNVALNVFNLLPYSRNDDISLIRMDANIEKAIRLLFESVQTRLTAIFPDSVLRRWAKAMLVGANNAAKKNVAKVAKTVGAEVEPLMSDKELSPYFQNVVNENVGLIRSITQQKLPTFKNTLVSLITQDETQATISKVIQKQFNLSKAKARVLARDQVGKLNGKLNRYRQEQIGGKRYRWRTMGDERVRDDHSRLEGKIFSWAKPPVIDKKTGRRGHPGDDYQDRCWAEMVLDDVVQ